MKLGPALKKKLMMFVAMIVFMAFYMLVFGSKNMVIGLTIMLAAFMSLGNDLSFKPKLSFIKVFSLLLVLGIAAYLNNPLTIWGCILTFIVVFATTFTSYKMFGLNTYLPYLMCYFMMISSQVGLENLPMRILALLFGAIFIVGLNIVVNSKKDYKLSKATIDGLVNELDRSIDSKLNDEEISHENFKTVNGLYLAIFNKFEYKYFPTEKHQSALNLIKSFQYIGFLIADYNFSENELKYTKEVLSEIREINPEDIFTGVEIETNEMSLILLNLEIIANEVHKDWTGDISLPDKKIIMTLMMPILKNEFSLKSPKFIFAFKMAFILFIWQLLTLIFNLPFTKWLYFATIPLMLPYINDVAYSARSRFHGTLIGVFVFAIIMLVIPYLNVSFNVVLMFVMVICMLIMVVKLEDKLILTIATTIISVMTALMYIELPEAMFLKVLWVTVAVAVVTLFNYKFLPYSVEIETENNLKLSQKFNLQSINLIKQKCISNTSTEKTTVLVVSNIVRENIEVTDENRQLYELQIKITDICNFILNYLDFNEISSDLAENLVDIIDNNNGIDENLNVKDKIMAYSTDYVMKLYKNEKEIIEEIL